MLPNLLKIRPNWVKLEYVLCNYMLNIVMSFTFIQDQLGATRYYVSNDLRYTLLAYEVDSVRIKLYCEGLGNNL